MKLQHWIILTALITTAALVPASAHPVRRPMVVSRWAVAPVRPLGFGMAPGRIVAVVNGNVGRVDFNVKPKDSKIWVDGGYIGVADQYDGGFFGTTATLKSGTHRVRIVAPDGQEVVRKIYVMPGKELNLNITF